MYTRQELINRLIRVDNISPDLDRADRVICMSEILAEACQFVGVPPEKITTLGNRVSTSRFKPAKDEVYDVKTIKILFIGRLEKQKNIHGIASALVRLRSSGYSGTTKTCDPGEGSKSSCNRPTSGLLRLRAYLLMIPWYTSWRKYRD